MADYDSSLPIRSEADGTDERLHAKIVDGVNPSQRMTVDADLNAHVEMHGNDAAGVDRVVRMSEVGNIALNGDYDATNNTIPSSAQIIASDRSASPGLTTQNLRPTAIAGASNSMNLDIALHDESGAAYSAANPLPVAIAETEGGTKIHVHTISAALAANASVDVDYTVTAAKTFRLNRFLVSSSAKIKAILKNGPVATLVSRVTQFNSTANPNLGSEMNPSLDTTDASTGTVRITLTNLDNQAADVYTTLMGIEI